MSDAAAAKGGHALTRGDKLLHKDLPVMWSLPRNSECVKVAWPSERPSVRSPLQRDLVCLHYASSQVAVEGSSAV